MNNLYGTLPPEYSNLMHLTDLFLMVNSLSGTFPDEYQKLRTLQGFGMGINTFAGTIPETYEEMTSMELFYVAHNQLTGTIPLLLFEVFDQMTHFDVADNLLEGTLPMISRKDLAMTSFHCENNFISGTVPRGMTGLTRMKITDLSGNRFSGTLTAENIHNLIDLKILRMNDNEFSGTIPSYVGNHRSLKELDLARNSFTGSLPSELGELFYLERLDLSANDLSGTIPTELGEMTRLTSLNIASNALTSTLPPELVGLTDTLNYFFLNGTNITGGLEETFCAIGNNNNKTNSSLVTEIKADCLGSDPQIPCNCCTTCCHRGEDDCEIDLPKYCQIRAAEFESEVERGANCTCLEDGSRVDCVDTKCESCSLDQTFCATNEYSDIFDTNTGNILQFHNTIRYSTGEWKGVEIQFDAFLGEDDQYCTVSVNGETCRQCTFTACTGNNFGYDIWCDNLAPGRYQYSACDSINSKNPGYLSIFETHSKGLFSGCILMLPHLSDYETT